MRLVLDCETSFFNKGSAFDHRNKLCAIGLHDGDSDFAFKIEHGFEEYGTALREVQRYLDGCDLLVLFNGKFDLHWLRRAGLVLRDDCKVWDCQLFDFIASNQQWKYPSLEGSCLQRGIEGKEKGIEEDYWSKGINTDQIPWGVVDLRVRSDVIITRQLFEKQKEEFEGWSRQRQNLYRLHCSDLLVLEEIEWNGLKYDVENSKIEAKRAREELENLDSKIKGLVGEERINLNSPDHKSAILYGGSVSFDVQEQIGFFKSGEKKGLPRYRWAEEVVTFPRLIEPLDTSKLAKEGLYSTDSDTLLGVKARGRGKTILRLLQERANINTRLTRYLEGLPLLLLGYGTRDSENLHGTINQCVAVTGRTSSSKPNFQNFDKTLKHLFPSRFV